VHCVPNCPAATADIAFDSPPSDADLAPYQGLPCAIYFSYIYLFSIFLVLIGFPGSPWSAIDSMLEAASFRPGHRVLDLGAGDGRVLIRAIQRGATFAEGWELNQSAFDIGISHLQSALTDVDRNKCALVFGDARKSQPQTFDIVTLFLLPRGLEILEPWLRLKLRGTQTKVVTQGWSFPNLKAVAVRQDRHNGASMYVYQFDRT
jgi:SAM-dependent methyltransferase